jgi:tight adherence protein C
MTFFLISAGVTVFLLTVVIFLFLTRNATVEDRLMAVAARPHDTNPASLAQDPAVGLAAWASSVTNAVRPVRHFIMSNDEDMAYRLVQAGFRKPQHLEVYTAAKMLLPLLAIVASTFAGDNWVAVALVGGLVGFLGPDFFLTHLTNKRKDAITRALPDALDLLVICMEAGLGIDQALVRVGEDVRLTCPALAEEFVIINREQRAGKQRLEAWRSMSERVDIDFVRQFVTMLVQTERFGTPISHALGSFADSMRTRRMQLVEEQAAKSGVKLLFPLVLFIFPSIFVVLLGPAILNIAKGLSDFLK